jgi:hypothetical protein
VLEFAGKDPLAVGNGVGDLFELEGAFEGDGVGQPVAKVVWGGTD